MRYLIICLFLLAFPLAAELVKPACAAAGGKKTYGLYEKVVLPDIGPGPVEAKLDTGAATSSLGAHGIKVFEREGDNWVRFTPQIDGAAEMELPLSRHTRIRQRAGESGAAASVRRPVVLLNICLNGEAYQIEVNLADRSRFNYPLLIGASALIDMGAVVDPSIYNTVSANCP